jgi:hypothetical protein
MPNRDRVDAEIEKLKSELQACQVRNSEIIRQNVENFNRRESEIQKQLARLKAALRDALLEIETAHAERKAVLDKNERLSQFVREFSELYERRPCEAYTQLKIQADHL